MKTTKIYFIALTGLMLSCAGNAPETVNEDTTGVSVDTLSAGNAFEDFKVYVNQLDRTVENVDSVFARYENAKVNFTPQQKDSAFFVTVGFMQSFDISDDEIGDLSEEKQKEIEKKYNKAGFEIWYEEGYPYAMPDLKFVEAKFKKDISAELDDYLDVYKKTCIQTTSDAGLVIEWSELAELILVCEEYLAENRDSKYTDQVLADYMENLNFLMWGLDNTPIIDYWTDETVKQLDENVSDVYQKLIKDTKHKTGKIIADHLTWLESKSFVFEYDEVKFLSEDEVKMYLGL
ncbi:MAG: hypothetical protein HYZ14_04295 [Bacteroidetes bacterium]|nr:hypothetical protein [Bacteroidota bacterium]